MNKGFNFSGAVVWITGASSGIGEELARQAAAKGAKLVLSARQEAELARVRDACLADGSPDALVLPLDIIDYDTMAAKTRAAVEHFGRIDLLVNNAGISQRSFCVDTDFSVYRQMMEINVLGQIALTQAVLPVMLAQGSGHIAVTSSVAGKAGVPLRTGYCAAKHAVMGFFDALRAEVAADGIAVTTITPGFIQTKVARNALTADGTPLGRDDEDIAGGMPVGDCVRAIVAGFEAGTPEIAMGGELELGLLTLKRENPEQAFELLAQLAADARSKAAD
ncbi:SDR family oxidoreductase [Pseudohaliea rubra]|uniref:Oxidoreductase, short-chain dehydrogenase/reductase family n=1 Tax=Pseudohaliea rubra DSM 19751 TaxID=1265313 RepID=A0A095VRH2_9GAMM|nr:SDR family oxidoreductase [Pseudohaliea rubra]KGE03668.1 oxidoreductase, short-chain dehydrogenase/reductase family [Pseudohaliea rubra DSM 19751]